MTAGTSSSPVAEFPCRACDCVRPVASRDKSQSGLPICTCHHLIACHDQHGITWGQVGTGIGRTERPAVNGHRTERPF